PAVPGLAACFVFTKETKSFLRKSASVGAAFFSRMPTSPLANDVRCAASIWRATLSLPCFVDSRTSFPCHMNLYQYTPHDPRSPHLLHLRFGPFLSQPRL